MAVVLGFNAKPPGTGGVNDANEVQGVKPFANPQAFGGVADLQHGGGNSGFGGHVAGSNYQLGDKLTGKIVTIRHLGPIAQPNAVFVAGPKREEVPQNVIFRQKKEMGIIKERLNPWAKRS